MHSAIPEDDDLSGLRYEFTIQPFRDDETPFQFCERCGSQDFDIVDVIGFMRHNPVKFIKDILRMKIF